MATIENKERTVPRARYHTACIALCWSRGHCFQNPIRNLFYAVCCCCALFNDMWLLFLYCVLYKASAVLVRLFSQRRGMVVCAPPLLSLYFVCVKLNDICICVVVVLLFRCGRWGLVYGTTKNIHTINHVVLESITFFIIMINGPKVTKH